LKKRVNYEEETLLYGFLLDLDGTLYHGDAPIPYAPEFIEWLRDLGYPYLYVTNNSSRTPEQVTGHLKKTGIAAEPEEVLTSSQAAALYVRNKQSGNMVYAIGEIGLQAHYVNKVLRLCRKTGNRILLCRE
jgi:4-nitrophenyl phosphatase